MVKATRILATMLLSLAVAPTIWGQAQNFPDRRSFILNNCPALELSDFSFRNVERGSSGTRFEETLKWKNIGDKAIVAFEIVLLKYDPFDRRLLGTRFLVEGRNSIDWKPLQPGESADDGTLGYGSEDVFTAIAYVRAVRFTDGSIWRANEMEALSKMKALKTGIQEFGDVKPDPKPAPTK